MKTTVDACGLSCPEPVLMLKKVADDSNEIDLLVDSQVCVENCSRFAKSKGFSIAVSSENGIYTMALTKE